MRMLVVSFSLFLRFAASYQLHPYRPSTIPCRRSGPPALSLLRVDASAESIDSMLGQAGAAQGVVALHFTSREHGLSNALVERCATQFASSMLYGGPSCSIIELMLPDVGSPLFGSAAERLDQVGAGDEARPVVFVYQKGELLRSCPPSELQGTLVALGVRWAGGKDNQADRDFGTSGQPSATAVDEIDFTGGAGNTGRPSARWTSPLRDVTWPSLTRCAVCPCVLRPQLGQERRWPYDGRLPPRPGRQAR